MRKLNFTSIGVASYWIQAVVDAHVCLSSREGAASTNLLPETLQIFQKLFYYGDETFAHSLLFSISGLIRNCIKQDTQAAIQCLIMLNNCLNIQNVRIWTYVLKSISVLIEEAQSALNSDEFSKVLNLLASMREQDECLCRDEIDEVLFLQLSYT